jgi:hypothetical protein
MKGNPWRADKGVEEQRYHKDAHVRQRLENWLDNVHPEFNGPRATNDKAGWPQFCKNPIEQWDYLFRQAYSPERLAEAKAALDAYRATDKGMIAYRDDESSGGKRRKRTKFNKRKSSSRRLSKSRRRTHRK